MAMKSKLTGRAKRYFLYALRAMECLFVVLLIYLVSLFFHVQKFSGDWVDDLLSGHVSTNFHVHVDSVAFGFRHGVSLQGLKVYDLCTTNGSGVMASADMVSVHPLERRLRIVGARYPRLPDGYYEPGNHEKNAWVECELPELGDFRLELERPDILDVAPYRVTARIEVSRHRVSFDRARLQWRMEDPTTGVDGFCSVDFDKQEIYGEVDGLATQLQIRPLLVALDLPVSLPYMDGFTDVPDMVPAWCSWKVNLVNNDFDYSLKVSTGNCRYNGVPVDKATGIIRLHSYTRGDCLNYHTEVGPIVATDVEKRPLDGTVDIVGTNRYNVVTVTANSGMPLADLLRIGGFTGDYVSDDVIGKTTGKLIFRFPRSMTNNYEVLNGEGHLKITDGHLTRFKLFAGLTEQLAERVPGVSSIVDSTAASADYRIENGVLKTDNIYIEGGLFSVKMSGWFDAVKNDMDFRVRVQFSKNDTLLGKYLINPVTWPFTKLLFEFRLKGRPDEPKWEYVSVLDRVLEVLK